LSWPEEGEDVDLDNDLVQGYDTQEDREGIEVVVNDVEDGVGNVPAATKIADKKTEDKGHGIQS
jgi:hypothetical protein